MDNSSDKRCQNFPWNRDEKVSEAIVLARSTLFRPHAMANGESRRTRRTTTPKPSTTTNGQLLPPLFTTAEWRRIAATLRLSPRMSQIAELIVRTAQDKQIEAELGIRICTIRNHINQMFARLEINSRTELMYQVFATFRGHVDRRTTGHQ